MKHLDVVDGELAAVPAEERPAESIIGQPEQQQLQLLDLVAHITKNISCSPTAWYSALHVCTLTDEAIRYSDHQLIDQLGLEGIHHGCLFGSSGKSLCPVL